MELQWQGFVGDIAQYEYSLDPAEERWDVLPNSAEAVTVDHMDWLPPGDVSRTVTVRLRARSPWGTASAAAPCDITLDPSPPVPSPLYIGPAARDAYSGAAGCEAKAAWFRNESNATVWPGYALLETVAGAWGDVVSWHEFADCESAAVSYALAWGSEPYTADVQPFRPVDGLSQALVPLEFDALPLYLTVRGTNAAGLAAYSLLSFGTDVTAPGPGGVDADAFAASHVRVSVRGFPDPDTEIVRWEYCVGLRPNDARVAAARAFNCSDCTTPFSAMLELPAGAHYGVPWYVGVRARNRAGLWSFWEYSGPFRADGTAPLVGSVTLGGSAQTAVGGILYTPTPHVPVRWAGVGDPDSGIAALAAVLTPQGGSPATVPVSGTAADGSANVTVGTAGVPVYVAVRVTNGAGLDTMLPLPTGVQYDPTPPRPAGGVRLFTAGVDPLPAALVSLPVDADKVPPPPPR